MPGDFPGPKPRRVVSERYTTVTYAGRLTGFWRVRSRGTLKGFASTGFRGNLEDNPAAAGALLRRVLRYQWFPALLALAALAGYFAMSRLRVGSSGSPHGRGAIHQHWEIFLAGRIR